MRIEHLIARLQNIANTHPGIDVTVDGEQAVEDIHVVDHGSSSYASIRIVSIPNTEESTLTPESFIVSCETCESSRRAFRTPGEIFPPVHCKDCGSPKVILS